MQTMRSKGKGNGKKINDCENSISEEKQTTSFAQLHVLGGMCVD